MFDESLSTLPDQIPFGKSDSRPSGASGRRPGSGQSGCAGRVELFPVANYPGWKFSDMENFL